MNEDDLLDTLLSVATKELSELQEQSKLSHQKKVAEIPLQQQTDLFAAKNYSMGNRSEKSVFTTIHSGDTDSSEDEERRNPEDKKYNDCGKEIKYLLASSAVPANDNSRSTRDVGWKRKPQTNNQLSAPQKLTPNKTEDVYTDPVFGLRIVNPVISSAELQQRMAGRMVLPFSRIKNFVQNKEISGDFVIAGVIINKSAVKTSQKGTQYSLWFLSDLKGDIKTISLFLFGNAHKQLWKTATGSVIGVLNPCILDKKDGSKDEGCFSIDNPHMVMILGHSKDLGVCRSKKKNGEPCTAIVNLSRCEFCIYHVQQEYQKCSRRSELQSTFSGRGLTALRNKVLGKDQVFYAGKLYTAIPAKKNKKHEQRDEMRLQSLSGISSISKNIVKAKNVSNKKGLAAKLDVSVNQRKKDIETLKKLGVCVGNSLFGKQQRDTITHSTSALDIQESKNIAVSILSKLKEQKKNKETVSDVNCSQHKKIDVSTTYFDVKQSPSTTSTLSDNVNKSIRQHSDNLQNTYNNTIMKTQENTGFPLLGDLNNTIIDLNTPITNKHINRAKLNAIKYIQKNGPIKKVDPNVTSSQKKKVVLKQPEEELKKKIQESEFFSERFKKMMETTSSHTDLLEQRDEEEKEKYFHKLEMKENMEEKMATTYKVACKAVTCLQCKYTNFSAADLCKAEKHPLKVFDCMKRFFKCGNCGNRTVSLKVVPTDPCKNCGSGKWERTGMMKEKIVQAKPTLSIRGGEQKFVNSVMSDANVDLLVPDEI